MNANVPQALGVITAEIVWAETVVFAPRNLTLGLFDDPTFGYMIMFLSKSAIYFYCSEMVVCHVFSLYAEMKVIFTYPFAELYVARFVMAFPLNVEEPL